MQNGARGDVLRGIAIQHSGETVPASRWTSSSSGLMSGRSREMTQRGLYQSWLALCCMRGHPESAEIADGGASPSEAVGGVVEQK